MQNKGLLSADQTGIPTYFFYQIFDSDECFQEPTQKDANEKMR
jgi:hypothetical protein